MTARDGSAAPRLEARECSGSAAPQRTCSRRRRARGTQGGFRQHGAGAVPRRRDRSGRLRANRQLPGQKLRIPVQLTRDGHPEVGATMRGVARRSSNASYSTAAIGVGTPRCARPVARAEPARRASLLRGPRLAVVEPVARVRARGPAAKADLVWRIAREPKAVWVGRFTRAELPRQGPPDLRPRPRAGRRADHDGHACPVHALRRRPKRRRTGGGRAHARLVRRPRPRHRSRPSRDRIRAGLARHDRLPRAQPSRRPLPAAPLRRHERCRATRTRRSTSRLAPPTGRARAGWRGSSAGSASRRCVASC